MYLKIKALSFTDLVIGPAWSSDEAKAIIPHLEHLPYVGFKPTVPQKDAGCLIDPPVSVPSAAGANLPETADAEPPDDPPGTKSLFLLQGLILYQNN